MKTVMLTFRIVFFNPRKATSLARNAVYSADVAVDEATGRLYKSRFDDEFSHQLVSFAGPRSVKKKRRVARRV
jgi:hypothetical protein